MSEEKKEEKKKYTVVDKRRGDSEESAPAEPKPEPKAEPVAKPQVDEQEEYIDEGEEGMPRIIGAGDVMRIVLGLLREHAILSLGLVVGPPGAKLKFSPDEAKRTAEIFRDIVTKRRADLQQETPDELPDAGLRETILFAFQMLQSQIFIFMGLIADPGTGLIAKRPEQARACIDFFNDLLETVRGDLDANDIRAIEGMLSDLRLNFVKQLNLS